MTQAIETYKKAVLQAMMITEEQLLSSTRIQQAVMGRMLLTRFCFSTGMSFLDIAKVIKKDRTTVIYMMKKSNELIATRDHKLLTAWRNTNENLKQVDPVIAEKFPVPDIKKQQLEQLRLLCNRLAEREVWLRNPDHQSHPDYLMIRNDKNAIIDQILEIEAQLH